MDTWIIVAIVAGVFVLFLLIAIGLYNSLVRKRVDTDNGWAQIDVQLKRRYDLIPNLVETVKGYASHERETLDAVISARQQAVTVTSDAAHAASKAQAEGALSGALSRLIAVAEAYPQLKADANFRQLQEELASTENKIGFARQHYNDTVGRYEETRQTFPSNLIAAMFNFKEREYFKLEESAQREAPKVSFKA
jgi:LemA protein